MEEKRLLKSLLPRLNRHALGEFYAQLASSESNSDYCPVENLPEAGEDVYYQPYLDSYGSSIHDVILVHAPPLELFAPDRVFSFREPSLIEKLARIRNLYHRRWGSWGLVSEHLKRDRALQGLRFINHAIDVNREVYDSFLIPEYDRLRRFCGIPRVRIFVGSWDSFLDSNPKDLFTRLQRFLAGRNDGVALSYTKDGPRVRHFQAERNLASGVLPTVEMPYEPVFTGALINDRALVYQFEKLLMADPSEKEIEDFLYSNYRELFGSNYLQIESQVWLGCPEEDIRGKDRRLDLFLRNSISTDWDLFEVKGPIKLTVDYRGIPSFASEVHHAIQQTDNYLKILSQDSVKRRLAQMGIEYYQPVATLIIGRSSDIPMQEWAWLKATNNSRVKILSYDELMGELKSRQKDRYAIFSRLNG